MSKIVFIAIGGNSLIKDKSKISFQDQLKTAAETCDHIIGMINADYNIVITHGNGPQVGFSLIRSDMASNVLPIVPMDACGADTQGTIGYMIQQPLYNKFKVKNINKKAVTIVTQVKIDKDDPAFKNPTKPQLALFILKKKLRNYKKKKVGLSLKIQVEDIEE